MKTKNLGKSMGCAIVTFLVMGLAHAAELVVNQTYFLKTELAVQDSSGAAKYAPAAASFTVNKKNPEEAILSRSRIPGTQVRSPPVTRVAPY
jgi:hypothetical protein